jgi:hypothetical protein
MKENNTTTHRLIVTEWISIIGVFVACFFFLHTEIKGMECRIDARMLAQEQRTDRLYEMWCETQKEIKQIYIERSKN